LKKLFWIIPLCLVIIAAITIPLVMWQKAEAKANDATKNQENLAVQASFVQTYGNTAKVNNFVKPEDIKIYGVNWSDETYNHTSICVNGVWVEIARTELPKSIQPTTTPTPEIKP
jgi:hypothetical protein